MTVCDKLFEHTCGHEISPVGAMAMDKREEMVRNISEGICPDCLVRLHPEDGMGHCPCCDYSWRVSSHEEGA